MKTLDRNERISFTRQGTTTNDYGEEIPGGDPVTIAEAWAQVRWGSGQERREAAQESATQAATFECLWTPELAGVMARDKIEFNSTYWDIIGHAPIGRNREIHFTAVSAYEVVIRRLSGTATGMAILNGLLSAEAQLEGTVVANSALAGTMSVSALLAGSVAASGSVAGTLVSRAILAGSVAATASASGTLTNWSPLDLGAALLAFWDAETVSTLTLSGGNVTTWADRVGGYAAAQAIAGSKPAYSATSFNGRPGVTFDGTDDELTLTPAPATLPTGATPGEVWFLTNQTALVADTASRTAGGYGSSSAGRTPVRAVASSQNRARAATGTGAGTTNTDIASDVLSGICIIRVQFGATTTTITVTNANGTFTMSGAVVPATVLTRLRIGAAVNSSTASGFWQGVHSANLYTQPLTAPQAALLTAFLKTRGGIA